MSAHRGEIGIVGLGAVTAYGWSLSDLRTGLVNGRVPAALHHVDGIDVLLARVNRSEGNGEARTISHRAVFAAVEEALSDSTEHGAPPSSTWGVIHCTGIGDIEMIRDEYFRNAKPLPSLFPNMLATALPSLIAMERGFHGPNLVLNAACASGNVAVLMARSWLRDGLVDGVLITASEFLVIREMVTAMRKLNVMCESPDPLDGCRPFQEGSGGFFLGECAVAIAVAARRESDYVSVLGGGVTHDAHHLVAAERSGAQIERAVRLALADGGVDASAVGYVNAHGTGTKNNDTAELAAYGRVFPDGIGLYSSKPFLGHCMAASAAVELVVATVGYADGIVSAPPLVAPGSRMLLDGPSAHSGKPTVCSSIGLGGCNAALVIGAG